MTIQQVRERASKAALTIKDTGPNPNAIARGESISAIARDLNLSRNPSRNT
jgi:hypothetical protein